jgi:uncharacterized protein YidB (DUF937 family)
MLTLYNLPFGLDKTSMRVSFKEDIMGLMDLVGGLLGGGNAQQGQGGGGMQGMLLNAAIGMIQNHPGGLQGLIGQFQQKGLGDAAQSWVGTGENHAIDASHISQVFGQDQIAGLAQQLGVGHEEAGSGLAAMLPQIINQLTPHGQVPENTGQGADIMGMLQGLMGGK